MQWFPGHMAKATKAIRERLKAVDAILEVRDARAPLSSANKTLDSMLRHKARIVALHKADLADQKQNQRLLRMVREEGVDAVFTTKERPKTIEKLSKSLLSCLHTKFPNARMLLAMVVGVPNVGKSTLINNMRGLSEIPHRSKAAVGPLPGVTRDLSAFQIGVNPAVYLLDTPGIMMPKVEDEITGLKLASIGIVKDSVVGEERIAEFLLEFLSRQDPSLVLGRMTFDHSRTRLNRAAFLAAMNAEEGNKVNMLMEQIGKGEAGSNYRLSSCRQMIRMFREGRLGQLSLDTEE